MNVNQILIFRLILVLCMILIIYCGAPIQPGDEFKIVVVNVGEGLAQLGCISGHALLWDVGPIEGYTNLKKEYLKLGSPYIERIIISNTDLDHCGGLSLVDSTIRWSGKITVSQYEDTIFLKQLFTKWKDNITFAIIKQGDVISDLNNIIVNCMWPSANFENNSVENRNQNSLAFIVKHGNASCFISSDLDSIAQKELLIDNSEVQSDILIASNHGSENYSTLFIQYICPKRVVISSSESNSFNHPSQKLLSFLFSLGIRIYFTYSDGTIEYTSNSFYWNNN